MSLRVVIGFIVRYCLREREKGRGGRKSGGAEPASRISKMFLQMLRVPFLP